MLSAKSKYILLLLLSVAVFSCKDSEDKKMEVSEAVSAEKDSGLKTFKGDFVYVADAAVLQVGNKIYSVKLDEKTEELAEMAKPAKKTDFDLVPVVIKGTVEPKPKNTEGWDNIITIKEIVSVSDTALPTDIKIEETKK